MTKKIVALLVLLGLASTLFWFVPSPEARPTPAPIADPASIALEVAGSRASEPKVETPTTASSRIAVTAQTAEEPLPTELWGVVLDAATKRPLVGARVELLRRDADAFWNLDLEYGRRIEALAQTRSDEQGRFRFDVVRAAPHRLLVEAAGFASRTALACTGGSVVTVELTRGSVLTGVVRCEGHPVPEIGVRIAVRGQSAELASGTTDVAGSFRFVSLPPGEVYVQVRGARFQETWQSLTLAASGEQHVEIELEAGKALRGRVLDATTGSPIQGARISDSWTMKRAVASASDGSFELAGLKDNRYVMCYVHADGYASFEANVGAKLDQELVVQLSRGGEVRGRVVDRDGSPICSTHVAVCTNFMKVSGISEADWIPARVDTNGRFVVSGLRSEFVYWLMARAPARGMRIYALPRAFADGEQHDVGDVILQPAAEIEGRVVDERGTPVVGCTVSVHGHNVDANAYLAEGGQVAAVPQFEGRDTRTDAKGRFRVPDLSGGTWRVSVQPKGSDKEVEQEVVLTDGEVKAGIELVIPTGLAIAGTLVAVDGKPFGGMVYIDAYGEGDVRDERFSALVAPDGAFRFDGMPRGRYTVVLAVRPKGQLMAPQFHVEAGTEGLRIPLEAASFVGGRVLDDAGKPVRANVSVSFADIPLGGSSTTLTAEDGSFRLEVPASFGGRVQAMPIEGNVFAPGSQNGASVAGVIAGQMDLVLRWKGPTKPQ